MLETMLCYTHQYVVSEKVPLSTKTLLILLMSVYFVKNQHFLQKQYHYSKQQCQNYVEDFLVLFSVFVRQKVTLNEKINFTFTCCASGIQLPDCSKLVKYKKKRQCCHSLLTWRHCQFFFEAVLFLSTSLVTGLNFMLISSLVLEL